MVTLKKLVFGTLAVATLSAGVAGAASADEIYVPVHIVRCYNITHQFYNPYTGMFYNTWRRVCE